MKLKKWAERKWQYALSEYQRVIDQSRDLLLTLQKLDGIDHEIRRRDTAIGWLISAERGFIFPIERDVGFFTVTNGNLERRAEPTPQSCYRVQLIADSLRIDDLGSKKNWILHTNATIRIEEQNWIVKLLPRKYSRFERSTTRTLLLLLSLFFSSNFGIAAEIPSYPSEFKFYETGKEDGKIVVNVALTHVDQGLTKFQVFSSSEAKLSIEQEKLPVRLWVLADVSTLCLPKKVDTYVNTLLSGLGNQLHPQSKISFASYSSHGNNIHLSNAGLSSLKDLKIQCDSGYLSSSFSSIVGELAKKEGPSQLPTYLWILSSGNIQLDPATLEWIKQLGLKVNLILYNPFLLEPVRATLNELSQSLGGNYFTVSVLDTENRLGIVPELYYRVRILTPIAFAGTQQRFKIQGTVQDKVIAESFFSAQAPERVYKHYLQKYSTQLVILIAVLIFLALAGSVYWYFKVMRCEACKKAVRRTQKYCLFCHSPAYGVLVEDEKSVYPLRNGKIEVGLHRQSAVKILKKRGEFRKAFFRIEAVRCGSQASDDGKSRDGRVFRIKRLVPQDVVEFTVNGERVADERFLSNGDSIQIRNSHFSFYSWIQAESGSTQ